MNLNIFNNKKRSSLNESSPIVAIDVGCRWGFAEKFVSDQLSSNLKVYGFDPDEEECKRLSELYNDLPSGFVNLEAIALGKKQGFAPIFITKEPACSSMYPPLQKLIDNYPALACIGLDKVAEVPVTTLQKWARSKDIKTIDYIKLDTQGSELDIMKGAGSLIKTARCIEIEVEFNPIYKNQNLFYEVDGYLRKKGFELWKLSNLVHYSNGGEKHQLNTNLQVHYDENVKQECKAFGGQLFWADAVYVNKDVLNVTSDQLIHYKRDLELFGLLGMTDIIRHMNRNIRQG